MKINKLEKRKKVMGYFFLIPSFFFLAVFLIYPMIKSMVMSFTDWNGFNPDYQWVGLKNYVDLFTDTPAYWSSMKINLIFKYFLLRFRRLWDFYWLLRCII